jgi:hypothetical protein
MGNIYLDENNIDDLGRMVTALLSELWIMRDRMAIMEKLLEENKIIAAGAIDDFVPSPAVSAELETLRDRMVASVIGAPLAAKDRSVDAILARAKMSRPAPETPGAA